jgi:hypothetical protein
LSRPSKHERHHLGRELSIKPRRTGYVHREIVTVTREVIGWDVNGEVVEGQVGTTEHGDRFTNLPVFAAAYDPCVWVTVDTAALLKTMLARFKDHPAFNYQIIHSTEVEVEGAYMENAARLTRFGFNSKKAREHGLRNKAMHTVWSPGDMARSPGDYLDGYTREDLLKFGTNVRDWCMEHDIPLPTALSGIGAALLRDARFWPHARGRVPRVTNENLRPHLPGVYSELRSDTSSTHHAMAIDQRQAYHRAAQTVKIPDPTTLYARGYFSAATEPSTPLWAVPGDGVFERTMSQPGMVLCQVSVRPIRTHESRPPGVTKPGRYRTALWTNEVAFAEEQGVTIEGIVAAWTSPDSDHGLAHYGRWAQERISEADEYRKRWLKPTLHGVYGLLAMRTRKVTIGHLRGKGERGLFTLGSGHEFPVRKKELPMLPSATTNVAALGTLQAEIRQRSLKMARALSAEGVEVLHIHADGIHVEGDLPLLTDEWSIKPLTNLTYLDRVSWTSDERDVLPGRDVHERIELRNHLRRMHQNAAIVISQKQAAHGGTHDGEG